MKNKILFPAVLLSAVSFSACTDLDTMPEGATITVEQKGQVVDIDPSKSEAGVNAIFSGLKTYMPNYTALGNVSRHNDFGYPTIMLFTDANSADFVGTDNGYNWTSSDLDYSDRVYTANECQMVWNNLYRMVFTANAVTSSISRDTDNPQSQYFLAQGLAARGWAYLIAAQLYQFNYKGHENDPCVCIITDENSSDVALNGAARSSVKEVYELINSDLTAAIELLTSAAKNGVSRPDKRYIDLAVAYGLRARMHMAMQDYAKAAADADAAINATSAKIATINEISAPYFTSAANSNMMWAILVAETDDVVSSGIVNWASHIGTLNYGYANYSKAFRINKALYQTIPATDARQGWFLDENSTSANLNAEQLAFCASYSYAPYTSVKFAPYKNEVGTSTNAVDIPLMRVEEMYLIKAEALARSGGDGASVLNAFVVNRDPSYTTSLSGEALAEEVYRQKRIELWGEGLIWYDIMRLGKGVDRRGAGFEATMVFNIAPDDPLLLWRIPEAEIQANPALSTEDNNPARPNPEPVQDI